jgi:hypothetical protein
MTEMKDTKFKILMRQSRLSMVRSGEMPKLLRKIAQNW